MHNAELPLAQLPNCFAIGRKISKNRGIFANSDDECLIRLWRLPIVRVRSIRKDFEGKGFA